MKRSLFALLLLLGAVGCAPNEETAEDFESETDEEIRRIPTLTFNTDGSVTQSAPLVAGSRVRVRYMQTRLTDCRGDYNGRPGWTITGYASINGGEPATFDTARLSYDGRRRLATSVLLSLPQAGDLALWFQNTSRWGCSAYDSRNGANYHFEIRPSTTAAPATIEFKADGSVTQSGALVAGTRVRVRYAQERLTACRGTTFGNPAWTITGYASLNGGRATTFETGAPTRDADRATIDAWVELAAPGDLALWFQNTSRWGCSAYDSRDGANYHFQVRSR